MGVSPKPRLPDCPAVKEIVDGKLNIPDHSALEANRGIGENGCSDT
jgi:hypothetical protein